MLDAICSIQLLENEPHFEQNRTTRREVFLYLHKLSYHPRMLYTASIIIKVESVKIVSYPPSAAVIGSCRRKDVIVTLIEGEGIISSMA